MHKKVTLHLTLALLGNIFGAALLSSVAAAQDSTQERPKLKNFGSSLKRLKWDPTKNAAAPTRRTEEKKSDADDEDVIRVETSLVVCDVLVIDKKGNVIEGLTRDDFVVTEDEQPQEVGTFALGDNVKVPRTIVLIIDYSSSQFPFIQTSVAAAKTLVDKLGPLDMMAIVTDDVELILDFTRDKEKLKKKLESLEKKATSGGRQFGRSSQYSSLMATLSEAFSGEDVRPVVIFQTDGDELSLLRDSVLTPSIPPNLPPELLEEAKKNLARALKFREKNVREFSLEDIYKAAEKSRATVYTVIPGLRFIGLSPDEQLAQHKAQMERHWAAWGFNPGMRKRWEEHFNKLPVEALRQQATHSLVMQQALFGVARVTGGWAEFLEDPAGADAVYSRILSDMNSRYVIGYYPSNKERDGRRRKVNVEVRGRPEYIVWGRKSYYAPGPEE